MVFSWKKKHPHRDIIFEKNEKAWPLLNETEDDWVRISDSPSDSLGKAVYRVFYSTFTQRETAWDIVQRLGTIGPLK